MNILVTQEADDELSREVWSFYVKTSPGRNARGFIVLDSYANEKRPTRRHKYRAVDEYSHMGPSRGYLVRADVPAPKDLSEIRRTLVAAFDLEVWWRTP